VPFDATDRNIEDIAEEYFRAKSFWITDVLQDEILAQAQTILYRALRQDRPLSDVTEELDNALRDFLPERDAAGRLVNIPHRVETIARTNVADAINAGRTVAFSDPETLAYIPALQYSAILDDRVRENHAAWDGVTREVSFWIDTNREPPNGYNCRCLLVPLTIADEYELTSDGDLPDAELPDQSFR
jgi:SPP1 gp7 family putative phage head morphogenesis protein